MASAPKFVTFHNPLRHPTMKPDGTTPDIDANGKPVTKEAVKLKFSMPTNEVGTSYEFEVEPGDEIQVASEMAYGVKIYAPQMVEGPAPKTSEAKKAEPKLEPKPTPKSSF